MAEKTTIARPYATAVFELASETDRLGEWSETLNLLQQVIANEHMQPVLDSPKLDAGALADLVIDICGERLDEQGQNLIRILTRAGRLALTPQVYQLYEQKRLAAENIIEVDVHSAYELDQSGQDRIAAAMSRRLGKKVTISSRTDESLIGGVIVRAGDSVIDASVRGRLEQLAREITE